MVVQMAEITSGAMAAFVLKPHGGSRRNKYYEYSLLLLDGDMQGSLKGHQN